MRLEKNERNRNVVPIATQAKDAFAVNTVKDSHFLHAQITIAHWYIDRALTPLVLPTDAMRFLQQAKEAYGLVVQFLPELGLDSTEVERIAQALSVLRLRLERATSE